MTSASDQAEGPLIRGGHQYGDVHVYGSAMLGDHVHMNTSQAHGDTEEEKRAALIDALDYSGANTKRAQLKLTDIGPSSFGWVKSTGLPQWLRSGTTPFWISGKPGSGKSTLMRYLVDSKSTQDQLDSGGDHWTILQFFYDYRAGNEVANNEIGMLRLFLLQLIQSVSSTASFLNNNDTRRRLANSTADDFIDLLATAIRSTAIHVCAFIDGLDEYDGNLWELCSQLETLRDRTGMKMCLASRPEPELENAFRGLPTITMQNHNNASIEYYMQRKLLQQSVKYPAIREAFTMRVQTTIREKAQGVMLWAKLVVDEILDAYSQSTNEEILFALLDTFPPELGRLYDRLMEKVPEVFRGDAILVLNLVANFYRDEGGLDDALLFETICFVCEKQTRSLFFGSQKLCTSIEFHIKSSLGRILDFVEVNDDNEDIAKTTVRLIHETLATHLRRSEWFRQWLPKGAEHYSGPCAWAHVILDVLNCVTKEEAFDTSKVRFQLENDSKPQQAWPRDIEPFELSPHLKSQKWSLSSNLLLYCLKFGVELLKINPVVIEARIELVRSVLMSDAMLLHLKLCQYCRSSFAYSPLAFAKLRRLTKGGRLDLAFATFHNLTSYLHHEPKAPDFGSRLVQAHFDVFVWNGVNGSSDDSHALIQRFAQYGLYVNGSHLCLLPDAVNIWEVNSLITCAQYTPASSWSTVHDKDCEYYGYSKSLILHWCQAAYNRYPPYSMISDLLEFLVRAGVDVNIRCDDQSTPMEFIFGISLRSLRDDINILVSKFLSLIKHGARPQLARRKGDVLSRAITLRRRCSIYNHTIGMVKANAVDHRALDSLDFMITILKHFKKTGSWPEEELKLLEKYVEFGILETG